MSNQTRPGSTPDDASARDNARADRERRIAALRALARGQQQLEPAQPARRARWLVIGAAVVCVVVVGTLALRGLLTPPARHTSTPPAHPAMLTLHPATAGIGCPGDAAWSPSGASVAVLGADTCGGGGVGLVSLYDAASGKLTTQIKLDDPVHAALTGLAPGVTGAPSIIYEHVSWAPDGQRIAVTFSVSYPDNPDTTLAIAGVLLSDPTGRQPHALVEEQHGVSRATRWDLQAGTGLTLPAARADAGGVLSTLPPALGYQWDTNGTLSPATPLPHDPAAAAPAPVPVGNPDGDANFTIWQPGIAALEVHMPDPDPALHDIAAQAYTFQTGFVAWSPDGRYLIEQMQLVGWFEPHGHPTPSKRQLDTLALAPAPLLPVRDVALAELLQQMDAGGGQIALAWRRYGEYVATQPVLSPQIAAQENDLPAAHTVTIYNCFTGQVAGSLTPESSIAPFFKAPSLLRWSPDGSHLLLYDENLRTVTIWGPGMLPGV
jgi:hypothetical protein